MTNKLLLEPEDIIVPAEYHIGKLEKLKEYFDLYNRGIFEHVPPVLVIDKKSKTLENLIRELNKFKDNQWIKLSYCVGEMHKQGAVERAKTDFDRLAVATGNARFYLIDGNHRTTAATLNHEPIFALEPEDTEDLRKLIEMSKIGMYPKIYREEDTLDSLRASFEYYCLDLNLDGVVSVRDRVNTLCHNHDIPHDMIRRYYWEFGINLK